MYDMTKFKTRYFTIKLKNNRVLDLEPPKLKILKKITALSAIKNSDELSEKEIANLIEAVSIAISKNKQGYKMNPEQIEDQFDIDETVDFLNNYFNWVNEMQNQKN